MLLNMGEGCLLSMLRDVPEEEVLELAECLDSPDLESLDCLDSLVSQNHTKDDDVLLIPDVWLMSLTEIQQMTPRVHIASPKANKLRVSLLHPQKTMTTNRYSEPRRVEELAAQAGVGLFVCVDGMLKFTPPGGCVCNRCETCFHKNVVEMHARHTWKVEPNDSHATFVQNMLLPGLHTNGSPGRRTAVETLAEAIGVPLAIWVNGSFRATPVCSCHCGACQNCLHKSIVTIRQVMFGTH